MKDISILIPTYNHACVELVHAIQQQASLLPISYEIIVADDGSTLASTIQGNRAINEYTNSRYIECPENVGRAAIRNYLVSQASKPWLLFIDSDMVVQHPDFLRRYVDTPDEQAVWDGGICVGGDEKLLCNNLRYHYERAAEHLHTAERRQQKPYRDFHTANFMAPKQLMAEHPFDMRFRRYGYEDVLFGMTLETCHIPIHHIDNPLSFEVFEDNEQFLNKTEEGLRTLYQFRNELKAGSRLLQEADHLQWALPLLRLSHRLFGRMERHILMHRSILWLFSFYKLGYFSNLYK